MSLDNGPSEHLLWTELACKDGTPYPEVFIKEGRAAKLAEVFEKVRALFNKPLTIHSAFRTPSHNKAIGGAKNSQHLQGRALDIAPPYGMSVDEFYNTIKLYAVRFGIRGIGKYKTFVHIDIRPTSRLVVWSGNGAKDSGTDS